jgi:hypothetical protein
MCRRLSTALTYPVFGRLVPRVGSCPASARAPRRLVPHVGSCPTNNMLIITKMKLL